MLIIKKLVNGKIEKGSSLNDLQSKNMVWVDMEEPTVQELQEIAKTTGLPYQELEEHLSPNKRPVIFDINDYSLIAFRSPFALKDEIKTKPLLFLVSKDKNDFISIHKIPSISLAIIRSLPQDNLKNIMEQGATGLLLAVFDQIVDSFFNTLDDINSSMDEIERDILSNRSDSKLMNRIQQTKKTLIFLHRALAANRDVVLTIEKDYLKNIDRELLTKFNMLYADIIQLIEIEATYRDILTSSLEVHLTQISNNINITMKKITGWGAIILVPSLIASIFGMNFKFMPETDLHYGFYLALFIMLLSVFIMFLYFKRKDWI